MKENLQVSRGLGTAASWEPELMGEESYPE